jgi:hypothetical protein|tara:strand:- start:129 stop:1466 length:1338 start_codon:yes stop_codon:yes gene_type:complete
MKRENELINRYLNQEITKEEVTELDELLKNKPELRREFYQQANVVTALEEEFSSNLPNENITITQPLLFNYKLMALAACLVLGIGALSFLFYDSKSQESRDIATLVSNENAAWESSLPTTPGSTLKPGIMSLKSGVATIRFLSGAEVTLEAPSKIELETPMRGKLHAGTAVVNVPETAHGFILSTPDGYAVDHGTAFAVSVNRNGKESDFEVLDGEISLHSPGGESLFLKQNESATLGVVGIFKNNSLNSKEPLPTLPLHHKNIRIQTQGKNLSIIRNDAFEYLDRDYLMVKLDTGGKPYERRSLLNFLIGEVDWKKVKNAKLRLNLVPCGLGHRVYLPKISRFKIFALAGFADIQWGENLKWDDSPTLQSATPVGNFEIPRSQERGSIVIETPELLSFLKENNQSEYTFIITRETTEIQGSGLVHAFASDYHPEASGPSLEVFF